MKTAKQELLEVLERLPDDAPMDTLLAEMHVKASVFRGLADIERGDIIDDAELGEWLNWWHEPSGRRKLSTRR